MPAALRDNHRIPGLSLELEYANQSEIPCPLFFHQVLAAAGKRACVPLGTLAGGARRLVALMEHLNLKTTRPAGIDLSLFHGTAVCHRHLPLLSLDLDSTERRFKNKQGHPRWKEESRIRAMYRAGYRRTISA